MLTAGCVIKKVRVSTRMIYKKDWCGDGADKYTGSALVSMDILLGSSGRAPVSGNLRAVISSEQDPEKKVIGARELTVTQGESLWKLSVTVPDAKLWYTWDMGEAPLYDLKLEFADARYQDRIGLKEVSYDGKTGILTLNRKRIFLRGVSADASADPSAIRKAGANAVIAETELPEETCRQFDEAGILIWRAYDLTEEALSEDGSSPYLEKVRKDAERLANHASLGLWSVELADGLCRTVDRSNARMAYANAVYETVKSVDPTREVLLESKAVKRAQGIFRTERLREVDPRSLKLPAVVPSVGTDGEDISLEKWAVQYLRIRKYDPVSALFAKHIRAAEDGALSPVLIAFEPGYCAGENGSAAKIEAGKSFTARIWAVNDLHQRIEDVKLLWSIAEKESGCVRAGNSFRLHLNADSAEIPDHAILVTDEEDKGKTFLLSAVLDTDEGVLSENRMEITVV